MSSSCSILKEFKKNICYKYYGQQFGALCRGTRFFIFKYCFTASCGFLLAMVATIGSIKTKLFVSRLGASCYKIVALRRVFGAPKH